MLGWKYFKSLVARAIPFDNSTNGWFATEVQSAIEEARSESFGNDLDSKQFGIPGNVSDSYLYTLFNVNSYDSPDTLAFNVFFRRFSFSSSNDIGSATLYLYKITAAGVRSIIYQENITGFRGYTPTDKNIAIYSSEAIYVRAVSNTGIKPASLSVIVWMRQT